MPITPGRPLLPGVAMAAAAALVIAPAAVPQAPLQAPPPVMRAYDVALTGIGQDIYYAITPVVQYVVGGVSYLINFTPLIGGPIAAQININYFQLVQPVVEATVNYLAAVVQNPLNFFPTTAAYGGELYDIGYNWVSAQAQFLGLQPLPPLPQIAATRTEPTAPDRTTRTASTRPERQAARTSRPAAAAAEKAVSTGSVKGRAAARTAR